MSSWIIASASIAYILILFGVAYYGDRRAAAGNSLTNNPYVYALSLAVYCTAWTFYGSVGRAASTGIGFLPIYLGPTLMATLWLLVLRKIIRITKINRITSIADFVGSRYGKSSRLAGLVAFIAVVGTVPYLSLQLKAISISFSVFIDEPFSFGWLPLPSDTSLNFAMLLAGFTILFGTRRPDITQHDEGLVLAVAFESIIKLVAFLAVGLFVTYGLYGGTTDLFTQAAAIPELRSLFRFAQAGSFSDWAWLTFLSMMAIMFLPRQFQMGVLENVDERHLRKAVWLFPLYLFLINIFVLPIALAGRIQEPLADADFYVLTLPLMHGRSALALLAYIGGLSAATAMVIVATVTLSTMVSNDLVLPALLKWRPLRLAEREDLTGVLLTLRRIAILVILALAYGYFRLAGGESLVSIGLISFAAVAQFAPAILGGIYWKRGNRLGAAVGLTSGFLIWAYTLPLPSLVDLGGLPTSFVESGPFGIAWLRPYHLFGLDGLQPLTHSLMWSLLANAGGYVVVSLLTTQTIGEAAQAARFVDVFIRPDQLGNLSLWRGTASIGALEALLARFLGRQRAAATLAEWRQTSDITLESFHSAPTHLIEEAERLLAGAIGAASANVMIASVVTEEPLTLDEVMYMLDETSQVIRYSRQLEAQSQELKRKTAALHEANVRLQELDQMKSDFVSHVTHELRTPLTSIRAFSEILYANPNLDLAQRNQFISIIMSESERLTRLINNVLDLSKIESGKAEWLLSEINMVDVVRESIAAVSQLFHERGIEPEVILPPTVPRITADRDRLVQVMLNLISNAIKFCDEREGWVQVRLQARINSVLVSVSDNGPGIKPEDIAIAFEKFQQVRDTVNGKPKGTGLGLPISRHIIEHFGGRLWVESRGRGATFCFELPVTRQQPPPELQQIQAWSV